MAENPYRLARDIRGIGFRTAGAIAARLGIEPTALIRLRAGLHYALLEATSEGHCGLPTAELLQLAGELLAVQADPSTDFNQVVLKPALAKVAAPPAASAGRSASWAASGPRLPTLR